MTTKTLPITLATYDAYPHHAGSWTGLSPRDRRTLLKVLPLIRPVCRRFCVSVQLGQTPPDLDQETQPPTRRQILHNWQMRADLAILLDKQWFVVEVKPYATHDAIGQTLLYTHIARHTFPELSTARPAIVTLAMHPDALIFARTQMAIQVWQDPESDFWHPTI